MFRLVRCIMVSLMPLIPILWPLPACAAEPQAAAEAAPELDAWGIVTSQAVTVGGHEFVNHFIAAWRDQAGSDRYTLAIRERPSARWGSLVWVEFGQQRVLQLQLPPARAGLKALADSAAERAWQTIIDIERQRRLVSDADLAPDEF